MPQQHSPKTRKTATVAKITRPTLSGILPRERLFDLVDRGRNSSVIWVNGPPGAGKTALVASYLEDRQPFSIWYQMDRDDADVATLFYYMGSAVEARSHADHLSLPLFTSEYHSDLSGFTRRYFQKLYQQMESSFVLVFDNYHEIAPPSAFHQVILDAVLEMPPDGCAIIISRGDPPPSMARLRANRAMEVISWNDLRLTRGETEQIVDIWGIQLSEESLDHLYDKTEGWAAGLVLLLDQAGPSVPVSEVPDLPTTQLIFDYLAGEVFQKFDTRTQEFMLGTAFLCEMTAAMANEVTGREDSEVILNDLHRNHHFVSLKHGSPAPFYAYHPLLGEFLSARADEILDNEQRFELRRASATALSGVGKASEAVSLLGEAKDWRGMTALIQEHAQTLLEHGRGETLEQWLEGLPEEVFTREPWFSYWRGACRFSKSTRESRILYEKAFQLFQSQSDQPSPGLFLACCGVMDSILYELDDLTLLDPWITVLENLLQASPNPLSTDIEARVTASMFMALILRQPQHPAINMWAERAATVAREMSDPNLRLSVELLVGIGATFIGYFSKARMVIETMRQLCESPQVTPLSLTSLKNVESIYYMFNAMHEECLAAVYDGLETAENSGVHIWSYHILSNGVAGALGAMDLDTARELLKRMENYSGLPKRVDSALYHFYSAWYAMLRSDIPRAYQEQKAALEQATQSGCTYYEALCRLAMVQVLIEYGDPTRAATYLRQIHDVVTQLNNRLLEFICFMVDAYIDFKQNKVETGLSALSKALSLGQENGYMYFLWWQPNMMAELCSRALDAGLNVDYVKALIRKRGLTPPTSLVTTEDWPWPFRVYTLGQFTILKKDRPLGFTSKIQRKPMELLKTIIAFDGEEIPEDRLARALWPGIDIDYARRSLTTTLHRLRKMLEEDAAIVLQRGRISLDRRFWWVDKWAINNVYAEIDDTCSQSSNGASLDSVATLAEKMFSLYRGPFMKDEPDQPWFVSQREHLRNKQLRHMGELARRYEEDGQWERAMDYYRRSIELDAVAEGFYRRLMFCYIRLSRPAEAIEIYESCRKTLRANQNSEPSPETQALYQKLIS